MTQTLNQYRTFPYQFDRQGYGDPNPIDDLDTKALSYLTILPNEIEKKSEKYLPKKHYLAC